ncbi:hypothetical protein [Blastomonas fulva]|jgi:hypothetical protein|uniref:hypothetical protein n=1 Tax=Blastomonas fulva TaxID=1550728 RepID=UPI003D2AB5ED
MHLFEALVVLHVIAGATGLIAFWVPIAARKGGPAHRKWGRIGTYAFLAAGTLAVLMALLSLYGPEQRLPMITDRVLFAGLFGWMMLYLGTLTIGFAIYGLAVVRHRANRAALRGFRYQAMFGAVIASALWCGYFGLSIGQPLMAAVATVGLAAVGTQQFYVWRASPPPRAHVPEHFRALLGMGISAYTAFLSVGLIRLVPDHVFNPLIWAVPSIIGIGLIIRFTLGARPARRGQPGRAHKQEA